MVCLLEPFSSIGIFRAQVPEGAVPRTDPSEGAQKHGSRADQGLQQDPSSISIRDVVRYGVPYGVPFVPKPSQVQTFVYDGSHLYMMALIYM